MGKWLRQQWFLIALALVMALAWLMPPAWTSEDWAQWLKRGSIATIFLCSGLALPSAVLGKALLSWRAWGSVQVLSFMIAPMLGLLAAQLLIAAGGSSVLATGFMLCAALPTTVAFCVAMSRAAGASEATAIIAAVFGNILGIVITPLWLIGASPERDALQFWPTLFHLLPLVLLPLMIGQVLRLGFARVLNRAGKVLSTIPLVMILLIVLISLAAEGSRNQPPSVWVVATTLVFAVLLHGTLLLISQTLSRLRLLNLSVEQRVSVIICGSQKTLALGIPIIVLCFPQHPQMALLMLPIIIYHPLQLLVAALWLPYWQQALSHQN